MDKFDTLTLSLYTIAAGILAAIASRIYILMKKFFNWAGKELAKSAIEETRTLLVEPTLVSIKNDIASLRASLNKLEVSVKLYKAEKHYIEGEHKQVVQVIVEQDHEAQEMLRNYYKENTKK